MRRSPRPLVRAGLALVATALVAALPVVSPRPQGAAALTPVATPPPGYWLVGGDGSVYSYGSAADQGSLRGTRLARPIAGMAPTPSGAGYWLVGTDGGIFSYGDAGFHGSTGALKLNQPIVGMAATPTGRGYWFVAADGGIFAFGDAKFFGSTGNVKLNKPIVGMAPTPTGNGYWFVASDGGIFAFGDAKFFGSTGAAKLNKPIVGMAATPTGNGYWFVASDGGIFSFGDASFLGSAGGSALPAGIVVMAGTRSPGATTPSTGSSTTTVTTGTSAPTTTTTTTVPGPPPTGQPFEIGLVGDTGYTADQYPIFDQVVEHMNGFDLSFVVHDGDIKDNVSGCRDETLTKVKESFNKSKAPFVYTPGDNEWMNCDDADHKTPVDSSARLGKLREEFFAHDHSLGQHPMPLTTQRDEKFPENARWTKEGVVFATINAPGPNDNIDYCVNPSPTCQYEAGPRRVANKGWLRQTFEYATATNAPAVMIVWQVNAWQPGPESQTPGGPVRNRRIWDYLLGCEDPTNPDCQEPGLRQLAKAFGKPVVLVHGDTHIPRIDQGGWPTNRNGGATVEMVGAFTDVPNFTRVETFAGGMPTSTSPIPPEPKKWIRVTVDPKTPQVFSFGTETAP